jgi:hypothetical protein
MSVETPLERGPVSAETRHRPETNSTRYASLLGLLLPFCPKLFIDLYKAGIGGSLGWKAQFTDDEKKLALLPVSH